MSSRVRFCPACGAEYLGEVDECRDCGVPLTAATVAAPAGDDVVYELDDWEPDLLDRLEGRLVAEGIAFGWEENRNLVVGEADADRVDDILDQLEDDPSEEVPYEAVSDLFVAADRLLHAPDDVTLAGQLVQAAHAVEATAAPFGVAPEEWARIKGLAAAVRHDLDHEATDEAIAADARALREILARYV
jgi:hypothetical protein